MDYRLREHVVKFQKLQAEALAELEAMIDLNANVDGANRLIKIQADLVYLNERFTRLMYLSGDIESEK
jgi:hypothetical protein